MNLRHITRFTYTYTNFQGWRVAINRQGTTLARYFSDKQYGSEDVARDEAIRFRDTLLDELNRNPQNTREILDKYRIQNPKPYPAGLKPSNSRTECEGSPSEQKVAACSIRSNHVMHRILRSICNRLKLDTASVLKLSLYMFALQYNEQSALADEITDSQSLMTNSAAPVTQREAPEETLRRLVAELEMLALRAGLPCFEEFSTGKRGRSTDPLYNASPPPQTQEEQLMNAQPTEQSIKSPHHSPPPLRNRPRLTSRLSTSAVLNDTPSQVHNAPHHIDTPPGIAPHILKPQSIKPGHALISLPPPGIKR